MSVLNSKQNFTKRILGLLLGISLYKCGHTLMSKLCFQATSIEGQNAIKMTRKKARFVWVGTISCALGLVPSLLFPANCSPALQWLQFTLSFTLFGCADVFPVQSLVKTQEKYHFPRFSEMSTLILPCHGDMDATNMPKVICHDQFC